MRKANKIIPKAILWDNDGVLVDTERWYYEATKRVMKEEGYSLTLDVYRKTFLKSNSGAWHLLKDCNKEYIRMPRFFKMINNEEDLRKRTDEDSPYYKKRITGFKKKIHPENMKVSEINEINLLREELKLTHKTYLSKIKTLSDRADYMECRYNNLFVQFSKYRKTSHEKEDKLIKDILNAEDDADKYFDDLLDCRVEKTGWIGRTLKFQYLFEQMKRIGLQQSEDIFECFEDIEVPEVSVKIKNRF